MLIREEVAVSKPDSYGQVRRNELWDVDAVGPWSIAIEVRYVTIPVYDNLNINASVHTE